MSVYAVLNEHRKPIAFHEHYEVCEEYAEGIYLAHNVRYEIVKLKKYKEDFYDPDLQLVHFHDMYIQAKYLSTYMNLGMRDSELVHCSTNIEAILGYFEMSKSDRKILRKAILVLDKLYRNMNNYSLSTDTLDEVYSLDRQFHDNMNDD